MLLGGQVWEMPARGASAWAGLIFGGAAPGACGASPGIFWAKRKGGEIRILSCRAGVLAERAKGRMVLRKPRDVGNCAGCVAWLLCAGGSYWKSGKEPSRRVIKDWIMRAKLALALDDIWRARK